MPFTENAAPLFGDVLVDTYLTAMLLDNVIPKTAGFSTTSVGYDNAGVRAYCLVLAVAKEFSGGSIPVVDFEVTIPFNRR